MSHFSTGFILQTKVPLRIYFLFLEARSLIFKTGPEEDKFRIKKDNVEYDSFSLLP